MNRWLVAVIFLAVLAFAVRSNFSIIQGPNENIRPEEQTEQQADNQAEQKEISGNIKKGETLSGIFKRYNLDMTELFSIKEASADVHRLRKLYPGQPYKIILDDKDKINSFVYWINDDTILNIDRTDTGFSASKVSVAYEKKIEHIGGTIKNNLVSSMGEDRESLLLALQLSDIFAWDIDFTTDLRNEDEFKMVVEGLYLDGKFKRYGDILSAEFINNKKTFNAYRSDCNGRNDYYDAQGRSLRKAFLKAPLSFRNISSRFSRGRYHPILKIYRPHHGIDYAAPSGTPVSTSGNGTVIFAGRKGQYGKLVIVKHNGGYKTYYGHLSRIKVGKGSRVDQGQIIGYVGQTGLATGPHLHYEMRINDRAVNPSSVKIPEGKAVPKNLMAEFIKLRDSMNTHLASISTTLIVSEKGLNKPADKKAG